MNRRFLLGGIAASLPLFAGCSALNSGGDTNGTNQSTRTTTPTAKNGATESESTETDAPETEASDSSMGTTIPYVSMIPVPSDPSDFDFSFAQYDVLRERQRQFPDFLPAADETATYPGAGGFSIPFGEIDTLLIAEVDVVIGPFEKQPIITTIQQQSDATLRENYKGYDIYVEPDDGSANAFSGDTLISALLPDPSLSEIKNTIDVLSGDGERFYDANDDFRTLADALGTGLYVNGQLSSDSESETIRDDVGFGVALTAEGGTPVFSIVVVFEDSAAANTGAVRELFVDDPEFGRYFTNPDDVTVERTGRVVTLAGEVNPEQAQTSTPTTGTPVATATPVTETPATQTTATTGSGQLELSPLTTYTNDVYGYQIDHPVSWTVNDGFPQQVGIANRDGDGIRITVFEGQYASNTVEEVADIALASTREAMVSVEVSERRETTLESGQPAIVLDITYDAPTDTAGSLRSYLLLTKQDDTVYQVEFVADASDWTPPVEREVRGIVESFALTDGTVALSRALAFVHSPAHPRGR